MCGEKIPDWLTGWRWTVEERERERETCGQSGVAVLSQRNIETTMTGNGNAQNFALPLFICLSRNVAGSVDMFSS